jgi:hypothetical protein
MRKRLFVYWLCCLGIYLGLFLFELFVLDPVFDYIGEDFYRHLLIYVVLLVIINPILTRFLSEKLKIAHIRKEREVLL